MKKTYGNAAIKRRDELPRISASQIGRANGADSIHRTEDGGQAEFFCDHGCIYRLMEYTPAEVAAEHARPLSRNML